VRDGILQIGTERYLDWRMTEIMTGRDEDLSQNAKGTKLPIGT
jgi:hypothetical protein